MRVVSFIACKAISVTSYTYAQSPGVEDHMHNLETSHLVCASLHGFAVAYYEDWKSQSIAWNSVAQSATSGKVTDVQDNETQL